MYGILTPELVRLAEQNKQRNRYMLIHTTTTTTTTTATTATTEINTINVNTLNSNHTV